MVSNGSVAVDFFWIMLLTQSFSQLVAGTVMPATILRSVAVYQLSRRAAWVRHSGRNT